MSGSQGAPTRALKSSPNFVKQGPLKATIPISSIVKHNTGYTKSTSPHSSSFKTGISPEYSGQRSPGSLSCKVKSRTGRASVGNGTSIRRTASLDTLYLKGQWPRDGFYFYTGTLQIDKATQTDESDWSENRKMPFISETSEDKLGKIIIKQKLQRTNNKEPVARIPLLPGNSALHGDHTLNTTTQTLTSYILSPTAKAHPVNIPMKPLARPTMRNSVEGLNQEIEKLVLKSSSSGGLQCSDRCEDHDKFCQVTPEGHRAPLADLFRNTRSRSVNTQTPTAGNLTGSCQSSGRSSRNSASPLVAGELETSASDTGDSQGSSPDQDSSRLGTSPHINRFLAREPPDGCEKVHLKSLEDRKSITLDRGPQPCTFQLKPSLGSAFQLLQPNLQGDKERDAPLVPSPESK